MEHAGVGRRLSLPRSRVAIVLRRGRQTSPRRQRAGGTLLKVLHHTIKKVGEDTDTLAFNTAISQMMIFANEVTAQEKRPRKLLEPFVLLLAPYAPHLAEELWEKLGHKQSLAYAPWPKYDEALLKERQGHRHPAGQWQDP